LETVDLSADGKTDRLAASAVYVFIGADAETTWLPEQIERDKDGFILTGDAVAGTNRWQRKRNPYLLETSLDGVFACGDVRCRSLKRVARSVGEGSMAIAFVHQFLQAG
jgi:thioredoxin reductase (NADPH)